MRSVSRILTIMYDRTIMMPFKLLLFFLGGFLLVKSCKMYPKTVQKVCSFYNCVIFGSLAGFILIENIFVMIAGALILSIAFVTVDRYFKNDGMFSIAFICIFNCIYMMVIGILYYVSDILYSRVETAEEMSWVCEYFDPDSQEENVFCVAIIIAVVLAVIIAKKVKKTSVLQFMIILFGVHLIIGAFLGTSYVVHPDPKVNHWTTVYLSILSLEYDRETLILFFIIIVTTLIMYVVGMLRKKYQEWKSKSKIKG